MCDGPWRPVEGFPAFQGRPRWRRRLRQAPGAHVCAFASDAHCGLDRKAIDSRIHTVQRGAAPICQSLTACSGATSISTFRSSPSRIQRARKTSIATKPAIEAHTGNHIAAR